MKKCNQYLVDIAINTSLAKYELSFKVLFNDIHSLLNDIVHDIE